MIDSLDTQLLDDEFNRWTAMKGHLDIKITRTAILAHILNEDFYNSCKMLNQPRIYYMTLGLHLAKKYQPENLNETIMLAKKLKGF